MIERWAESLTTLSERGLAVETGRHVSHRHPETLTHDRQEGAVPYIDRPHVRPNRLCWPQSEAQIKNYYNHGNDPNPIEVLEPGWYVAVNRFAPNEDDSRIRVCMIGPNVITNGFIGSNQTNIIRRDRNATRTTGRVETSEAGRNQTRAGNDQNGLEQETAEGLAAWINTAVANRIMTMRLGSTQVNALDLERLPVPTIAQLEDLRKEQAAGYHEATDARLVLEAMQETEQRAARTTEAMRRVRHRIKHELSGRTDLREDTTTLALIAVAHLSENAEIETPITKLTRQVITYIEQRHGRRLTEETRWHLEKKGVALDAFAQTSRQRRDQQQVDRDPEADHDSREVSRGGGAPRTKAGRHGMSSLNRIMLLGELPRDAEEGTGTDGRPELQVSVITKRRWTSRQGEDRESTEWHDIRYSFQVGEPTPAELFPYLIQGKQVHVEGSIATRTTPSAKTARRTVINANKIRLITGSQTQVDHGQPGRLSTLTGPPGRAMEPPPRREDNQDDRNAAGERLPARAPRSLQRTGRTSPEDDRTIRTCPHGDQPNRRQHGLGLHAPGRPRRTNRVGERDRVQ